MITYSNYQSKKQSINISDLPKGTVDDINELDDYHELYNDDKDIKKTFDDIIKIVNKIQFSNTPPKKEEEKDYTINDALLDSPNFRSFTPKHQLRSVNSDELISVVQKIEQQIKNIPNLYAQSDLGKQAIVHAHYFYAGSDWFITEYNPKTSEAYGYTILNGDVEMSEFGYMNIKEFQNNKKVELDFYWTKTPLDKVLYSIDSNYFKKPTTANNRQQQQVKNETTPATKQKVAAKVDLDTVSHYSTEYMLIRRFHNMVIKNETAPFRKIQLIYMAFQKAALERKVRKFSDDATLFNKVNSKIVKLYNAVESKEKDADIEIKDQAFLKELKLYVSSRKLNYAITLLKSFIGMQGFKPEAKKAANLLNRITSAIEKRKVTKDNRLYNQIELAKAELTKYLETPTKKIDAEIVGLSKPARVCENRVKCDGINKNGQLKKGYVFSSGGDVVKVPKKKSRGLAGYEVAELLPEKVNIPDIENTVTETPTAPTPPTAKKVVPAKKRTGNSLVKNLSATKNASKNVERYNISGDISEFLGDLEIKPKDSLAITVDAEQGAGKTRFVFQLLNEFASSGYKCLFVSLEEHPESRLFNDKVTEYINPANEHLIDTIGELPNWFKSLKDLIPYYDCIFIDSWSKIAEEDRIVDFDKHLRKGFDSKLFVTIFQRTTNGTMRGGTKSAFDGDVILKMEKAPDYKNSYVYANKNRYQNKPLDSLKYNIYHKALVKENELTTATTDFGYVAV